MLSFRNLSRLILALVVINSGCTNAAYISQNGGYNLVIAIDESTPPPSNVGIPKFLNNVQNIFTSFSNQLWLSTKNKFHVNSVHLLVPLEWDVSDADTATSQAFETADFKVSSLYESARVDNPNPCGSVGRNIELPVDFFSNNDTFIQKYGDPVRSVLNLFARYRYGTWEEHGEISNAQFPYFYFKTSQSPVWTFTGCSAELQGRILTSDGEESSECNAYTPTRPSENCRFIPADNNTISSSLNFLQWAPGVTEFCDSDTHNHDTPNRHNLFCGHRSVSEVIRDSDDYYQTVGKPLEELPEMSFHVVTNSQKPLLYILLDRGRTTASTETLDQIIQSLDTFLNDTSLPQDIITAVGTYPQTNPESKSHFYVKEEGEWSRIRNGSTKFASVIRATLQHYDGPVVRDFGLAIQEVVEKIRARNHAAGSIVLVIKRGSTQNGFEHSTYFGDVLSSIQKQNLRLYAIEIQHDQKTPYVNLERLTTHTFGQHLVINASIDVPAVLGPFLGGIKQRLTTNLDPAVNRTWTVFKGFIPLRQDISIPIQDDNIGSLTLCLTVKKYIPESEVEIRQVAGIPAKVNRIRRDEWNEVVDISKRTVIFVTISNPARGSIFDIVVNNCTSAVSDDCVVYLEASIETNDKTIPSGNLDIQISTSVENNYLDFDRSRRVTKVAPLSIFAIVESQSQRVFGLESVFATVIYENLRQWTVPLHDDGVGLPDVSENDGIYSGIFTPPQNGVYKISVTVTHSHGTDEESGDVVNLLGHLIPMDQSEFGCSPTSTERRCKAATISGNLTRSENMLGTILVEHSITFSPRPLRILDFRVTTLPENKLTFEFTSPKVLGIDGAKVDWYRIYMGSSVDQFVEGTDNLKLIVEREGLSPGELVTIPNYDMQQSATAFFAVESVFRNQPSGLSNVVGATATENGEIPVPQPTTTTVPPPTTLNTRTSTRSTSSRPSEPTPTRPGQTTQRPTTTRRSGGSLMTPSILAALVPLLIVFK